MKMIHLLYIIIVLILAILLYSYFKSVKWFSIIEGARTYPMPRRHPITYKYGTFHNDNQSNVISMNTIIDKYINQYFDQKGVPYLNTIQDVQNYVVGPGTGGIYNYGTVPLTMKSQLTDIGYYFIEMVLPLLPTQDNPKPTKRVLPTLRFSGMPGFPLHVSKIQQCMVYRGNAENNLQFNVNTNAINNYDNAFNRGFNSFFNGYNFPSGGTSTVTPPTSTSSGGSSSSDVDCTSADCDSDCCGITCPQSCFDAALGVNSSSSSGSETSAPSTDTSQNTSSHSNYQSSISNANILNGGNLTLQYANNQLTMCPSKATGYDISQVILTEGTYDNTTLLNKIQAKISEYFEEKENDPTQLVPKQKLLDDIEFYSKQYSPMDAYHMELLKELIFYGLQVIVPGLPSEVSNDQSSVTPHFYVEWRPFLKYQ